MIIIGKIVKANLEDDYCSKLRHLMKTDPLVKKINLHHFSHLLVDSKDCVWQYYKLEIPKDMYL